MSAPTGDPIEFQNRTAWQLIPTDPTRALDMSTQIYLEAEKADHRQGMGDAVFNRGWALVHLGRNQEALRQFTQALTFCTQADSPQAGRVYSGMVTAFTNLGILDEALDCLNKLHRINEKTGDVHGALVATLKTGWMNIELERWDQALLQLQEVESATREGAELADPGSLLEALAICMVHLDRYEEAEDYFARADLCPDAERDELYQISVALHRSIMLEKTGHGAAAMNQASQAIAIARRLGNQTQATKALLRLIEIRLVFGPVADSRRLIDEALALGDTAFPPAERIRALALRAVIAEQEGDLVSAIRDLKEARRREARLAKDRASIKLEVLNSRLALEKERRSHEAARQRNNELELLNLDLIWINRLGTIVNSSLDWQRIACDLYAELVTRLPLDSFGIARVLEADSRIEHFIQIENGELVDRPGGDQDRVRELTIEAAGTRRTHLWKGGDSCLAAVPLILFDEVIGVILAGCHGKAGIGDTHLSMLQAITPVLAASFKNAESFKALTRAKNEILHIANHDPLTGLYNRRFLFDVFDSFRSGVTRNGRLVCLFYLDLDRFKPINDHYGHKIGDLILKTVADRFLELFRESDVCARIGGDEFVVLAAIGTRHESQLVRQKMHDSLAKPVVSDGLQLGISASIGLAIDTDGRLSLDDLLHAADTQMLGNKKRRRA